MTDTEAKVLSLVNEIEVERYSIKRMQEISRKACIVDEALCRVIELLEATEARHAAELRELKERFDAFRQEVSDAAQSMETAMRTGMWQGVALDRLKQFILPKPDPLAEAVKACNYATLDAIEPEFAKDLEAALAARGYEVRKIVWEAGE